MLALLISLAVGFAVTFGLHAAGLGYGWATFLGMIGFAVVSFLQARYWGKRLQGIVTQVQEVMTRAQGEAVRLANRLQNQRGGSQKVAEAQLQKIMAAHIDEALAVLDTAKPLYRWNFLAERQLNTLRFQLLYQVQRWDECDALLNRIFLLDPLSFAMKMVRHYENEDDKALQKTYKKAIRRLKDEKATLIYALYSWILVKRKEIDQAVAVLVVGKGKCESEVLQKNWQCLANGKPQLFSNTGLGEQWLALQLEAPPKPKVTKGMVQKDPIFGRFRRKR